MFSTVIFLTKDEVTDRAGEPLAELCKNPQKEALVFVENGENLGFAKGSNVGVRLAASVGAKWVMLLNNDTVVSPDAFQQLRRFVRTNPSIYAITPEIRYYAEKTRIQDCGGILTYFGSRKYFYADMDAASVPQSAHAPVTFITGCALLFNHEITGPLTEDFFFGEEDYEFSLRMKQRGLAMGCARQAIIYHKRATSISKASTDLGKMLVYYACRLMDTRNYYSRLRWQATRILAYLYLPVLFVRNGISLRHVVYALRQIDSFIRTHRTMGASEFRELIAFRR